MTDITGIALSGLIASRTALSTVSHNIVNIDTAGYSRQRAEMLARTPIQYGTAFLGQGVDVNNVTRITNQYVTDQLRRDTQNFHAYDAYYEYAVRMDALLGDQSTAISPTLQSFFDALQALATDPSSIAARQVVLSESRAMVNRFNTVYDQVYQQNETLNVELKSITSQISQLAAELADLNVAIRSYSINSIGQLPNDLLDRRDETVRQIAELVGVQVQEQDDRTFNLFIGNGQPLVIGERSFQLDSEPTVNGIAKNNIAFVSGNTRIDISQQISGGRLGGLLQVREELLDPVFNELGRLAIVMADTFNAQHQLGMDLNNNLGGLFYGDINNPAAELARVSPGVKNAGNGTLSVTITDSAALKAANYQLIYDGNTDTYTLRNATTNANVETFANPGAGGSYTFATEGFALNFNGGTPASGDTYLVTPTRMGARDISLEIDSVDQVAAAMPVRTQLPASNTGTGFVERVVVTDTTTADFTTTPYSLQPPYTVVFTSPTTYDVINSATATVMVTGVAFNPNQPNALLQQAGLNAGYDIVFNGVPQTGDQVVVEYNHGGVSDNRNALLLTELRTAKTIGNGTATYQSSYGQLVSGVGTRTRDAQIGQEASQSILRQVEAQRESISGVNMDEEAADLMRFQQAYQSSARVIQLSSELFDSILNSL